jgi:hypothetical protein
MSSPEKELKERAERLFRQQQEGTKALTDYEAKEEATRLLTLPSCAPNVWREKQRVRSPRKHSHWLKTKNPKAPAATRAVDGTF